MRRYHRSDHAEAILAEGFSVLSVALIISGLVVSRAGSLASFAA